ncbi:hypothetical protein KR093_000406, partial [Drosophila rubida]
YSIVMNQDLNGARWTKFLFFICIFVTIGSMLPAGYCFGVINAPAEFIKKWSAQSLNSHYSVQLSRHETTLLWAGIVCSFQIGGIIGALCAAALNSRFGRVGVLRITSVMYTVSCLLQALCRFQIDSVEMLVLGRLIGGMSAAIVYATHPMYLVEIAPRELSGSVGVFTGIGVTGGIVVGQLFSFDFMLGTNEHWHWALSAFMLFVILGALISCFLPESPRYLIAQGRLEAAKSALKHLRSDEQSVDKELAAMVAEAGAAETSMSTKDVLWNAKLRMPIILVLSFHIVHQASGIGAIWYYSVGTFTEAGFNNATALWLNFGLGVLNFLTALAGILFVDKCQRRILLMCSCLLSALFMLLLSFGLYFTVSRFRADYQWLSYICIAFLALFITAFNTALGTMPYFLGSELLVVPPRAAIMALGSLSTWVSNFTSNLLFPILNDIVGPFAFLLFTVICLYGFLITYRYLPETKNRKPEEVAPLMENGFKSKIK